MKPIILSPAQCSSGTSQSRPFPARPMKIMVSASQCTKKGASVERQASCQRLGTPSHPPTFITRIGQGGVTNRRAWIASGTVSLSLRNTHPKPRGLDSNGKEQQERDGLYTERLARNSPCDGARRLAVSKACQDRDTSVAQAAQRRSFLRRALSPKTAYETAVDNRLVSSPNPFL